MAASTAEFPAKATGARGLSRLHVALIVLCGVLVRIVFLLAYKPIWAGDSPSYSLAYYFWAHHQFYLGERTPVYPLFLGLVQWMLRQPANILPGFPVVYTVILLQGVLNLVACVAFYFALRSLRVAERMSLWASIFLATLPALVLHEVQILNMSLGFTIITAIVAVYVSLLRRMEAGSSYPGLSFGLGILLGLAILNRPESLIFFAVLGFGTAAFRLRRSGNDGLRFLKAALLMTLGAAPLVFAWMTLMYAGIGEFRITTLDGWNKSRTVYNLFDRVPAEDQALGEVLTRSYQEQLKHKGEVNMREHMFIAFDDLKAHYGEFPIDHSIALHPSATNLKVAALAYRYLGLERVPCAVSQQIDCYENMRARIDLGDYIGDVSSKLMKRYPGAWLKNVVINWITESFNFSYVDRKESVFGFQPITVDGSTYLRSPVLDRVLTWAQRIESPLLTLCYVAALLCTCFAFLAVLGKLSTWSLAESSVLVLASAATLTIAVMCAIAGFNRIYHLPYLAVFVVCAVMLINRRRAGLQI